MGESMASQICRLLDAIDNRYDPLKLVEPLVDAANVRYGELRQAGFSTARHRMRVEAVEALMARGGNLPQRPVFDDD